MQTARDRRLGAEQAEIDIRAGRSLAGAMRASTVMRATLGRDFVAGYLDRFAMVKRTEGGL